MEPLRKRAFTLIEAVVAAALLVILGTVIWQLLSFGIRAHGKGEAHRLAQSNARQILDLLTSEMRSAVALPVATPTLKSAVLWPDPWGTQGGVSFNPTTFYGRVEQNEGTTNPILYDEVNNRVIFSRAGRQTGDQAFTSIDLGDYVYVEYVVPETARNTLVRNVYTTQGLTALATNNINDAQGDSSLEWLVDPGFFDG
ncbi:MAG: prepilin-type N-terminal cleavage/methylation domain-containing protein, partial [Candidatus Eremiobacteraeota bacterium]|nr:prepilin-type N-terminal cleavage/methylation domain-containing protein [Candidatus Eremiobacteraeota bacterium]